MHHTHAPIKCRHAILSLIQSLTSIQHLLLTRLLPPWSTSPLPSFPHPTIEHHSPGQHPPNLISFTEMHPLPPLTRSPGVRQHTTVAALHPLAVSTWSTHQHVYCRASFLAAVPFPCCRTPPTTTESPGCSSSPRPSFPLLPCHVLQANPGSNSP